jgi:GNAT superfamily N-acetyltransferase
MRFIAEPAEPLALEELSALRPANAFATPSFFESRRRLGYLPWILGMRGQAGGLELACGGFLKRGTVNRRLEIPSLPAVSADSPFWRGLREFCSREGVTAVALNTYGARRGVEIPEFGRYFTRVRRSEFVLDLRRDPWALLSAHHRRQVRRARKAALEIRSARSPEAAREHGALVSQSLDRRRSRGERIDGATASTELLAYLESGAGELFQAYDRGVVVSSALVLRAPEGAYFQSSGTSPAGMTLGASHWLVFAIACRLKDEGARIFNLGGAEEESTLAHFKREFGTARVPLASASCHLGSAWRRKAARAVSVIRTERHNLPHILFGGTKWLYVYAVDTDRARPPPSRPDLDFGALAPLQLRALSLNEPAFRAGQLPLLARFEGGCTYAVRMDHKIVHVSWLLPASQMKKDPPLVIPASPDVAEITGCETLPDYRGRGIYSFAIQNLIEVARRNGMRRVYMKTDVNNKPSWVGIEKAGLQRIGTAVLIGLPITQRIVVWRRF